MIDTSVSAGKTQERSLPQCQQTKVKKRTLNPVWDDKDDANADNIFKFHIRDAKHDAVVFQHLICISNV